jgi:hypothetical protein
MGEVGQGLSGQGREGEGCSAGPGGEGVAGEARQVICGRTHWLAVELASALAGGKRVSINARTAQEAQELLGRARAILRAADVTERGTATVHPQAQERSRDRL